MAGVYGAQPVCVVHVRSLPVVVVAMHMQEARLAAAYNDILRRQASGQVRAASRARFYCSGPRLVWEAGPDRCSSQYPIDHPADECRGA